MMKKQDNTSGCMFIHNKTIKVIGVISCLFVCLNSYADFGSSTALVPGDTGGMYYRLGGGDVTPLPYTDGGRNFNLNFDGNAGLGLNCGSFDPTASFVNSMNGMGNSFNKITQNVMNNMKGMLISEAGYLLAKSLPNVYKFARDGIDFGQFNYSLGFKSCEQGLAQADQGKNPANEWMKQAMNDDWKYHMSVASTQAARSGLLGEAKSDIVQAKSDVDKDAGKKGVQWVRGIPKDGTNYAGGEGQPTIMLTADTVIAGYNVLVGQNRDYDDKSAPTKDDDNKRLVDAFPTPLDAAKWVVSVVGEQEISTYAGGKKKSIPGKGLLNYVQDETKTVKDGLTDLVTSHGDSDLTVKNLKAVSPPKIMLNAAVINMLRKESNSLMQAIYVNKLSEEVAVARVIDKAKLGLQLLEVGQQVPTIFANDAAQKGINNGKDRMTKWIANLRSNPKDNEEFVGKTITTLMGATTAQELSSAAIRPSAVTPPVMQNGAIVKSDGN